MKLTDALLVNSRGEPVRGKDEAHCYDWDLISIWTSKTYLPYSVAPFIKGDKPRAVMHAAAVGQIEVSRFSYGVPVKIRDCLQETDKAFVLTTIGGRVRHYLNPAHGEVDTEFGDSFVVDCSRVDYALDLGPHHDQIILSIPHVLLEQVCVDWFGFIPGNALWQHKSCIGGQGSSWLALLEYIACCLSDAPNRLAHDRIGRHLEQTICVHLLNEWATHADLDLSDPGRCIAPRIVRLAEQYMIEHAMQLPSMIEVARVVGTSLRTLTGAFRKFRGYTPSYFLREQRLRGARRDLQAAIPEQTVAEVAAAWGYIHLGDFARAYRLRFGERPSQTLRH